MREAHRRAGARLAAAAGGPDAEQAGCLEMTDARGLILYRIDFVTSIAPAVLG